MLYFSGPLYKNYFNSGKPLKTTRQGHHLSPIERSPSKILNSVLLPIQNPTKVIVST